MAVSVLIVEDDRNIAELLQMYLEKEGYAVTIAGDGGKGLEKFRSIKPDLVLLRIDEVRGNSKELPLEICLYQSLPKGDKMDTIVQKAVELGASAIIPVEMSRCVVRLDDKKKKSKKKKNL